MRAASSAAITSSSPYRHRQLRASTRNPADCRCSTASCSPKEPISARVHDLMDTRSDAGPTRQRTHPQRRFHPQPHRIGFTGVKNGVQDRMSDRTLGGIADEATDSDAFEYAARAGFAVSGVLHLLIGYLIVQIAFGSGGNADQSGALATLAQQTGGSVLLWVVAVGLAALGLWRVAEAI